MGCDPGAPQYDASVIGKVFWPGAVAVLDATIGNGGLGEAELEGYLYWLERRQFVRWEQAFLVGQTKYAFVHVRALCRIWADPRAARAEGTPARPGGGHSRPACYDCWTSCCSRPTT